MARIAGMTWRHMKANLIDQNAGFPVLERGAEGAAWSFDIAAVLDWLIARAESEVRAIDQRASRIAKLVGIVANSDEGTKGNAKWSMDELRQATAAMMQIQRMKQEQGRYVAADTAVSFWNSYHLHFQQEVLGLLGRIDPAGQLSSEMRSVIENDMRGLLVDLQSRMEAFIREGDAKRSIAA